MVLDAAGELVCLGPRAGFTDEVPVPLPHGSRGVRRSWVPSLDGFGWGFFFWFFFGRFFPRAGAGQCPVWGFGLGQDRAARMLCGLGGGGGGGVSAGDAGPGH